MPGLEPFASHASAFLQWLLIASASATLIAGVVLIVQKIFGGWLTPGGRQRLWLLVIVRLLLPVLPASAFSIANLKFEMLWTSAHHEVRSDPASGQSMRMENNGDAASLKLAASPFTPLVVTSPIIQPTRSWGVIAWTAAFAAWAIVIIAMLGRLLWVNRAMSIRLGRAVVVNDQPTIELVRGCAKDAGLRTAPAIVVTDAVATPAVHGIWRSRILMPVSLLESLTPAQQRHVILHELSHIRHHDVLGNWLLAVLCIIHWFNPLLWLAIARMKSDRELARDAWAIRVMARGDRAPDTTGYAETLVDLAQRLNVRNVAVPLPALFGRTTSLRRRLQMIERVSESRSGSRLLGIVLMLAIAGGLLTRARAQTAPAIPTGTAVATTQPTTQRARRPQSRPTVESMTKLAQRRIEQKDYTGAINSLEEIQRLDPENVYAQSVLPFVEEKQRTMPEDVIQNKLNRILPSVRFDSLGLSNAVDFLHAVRGVNITVNWKALEAVGVDRTSPATMNIHDITLDKALTMILDQVSAKHHTKLGYVIDDSAIYITTQTELDNSADVRIYDVSDLLTSNDGKPRQQRSDELVKTIKDFIDHDTWKDNGGAVGTINEADGKLTVTQKPAGHRHIAALLQTMRNARASKD